MDVCGTGCIALGGMRALYNSAETPPEFPDETGPGDGGDLRCGCGCSLVEDGISGSDRSGGGIHVGRFSAELPVYLYLRGHASRRGGVLCGVGDHQPADCP